MLYTLARSALFQLDPELAHDVALKSLAALGPGAALLGAGAGTGESKRVMGIDFPNPVGIAAGLDKNGEYIDALAALGEKGRRSVSGLSWDSTVSALLAAAGLSR